MGPYKLCVITHAPDTDGNHADEDMWEAIEKEDDGIITTVAGPKYVSGIARVFRPGEIFVMDMRTMREVGGAGRAPNKWAVKYRVLDFSEMQEAVAISREAECEGRR